ncbi:MAG: AMP-binding protein [Thiohalomonadaceae bacterium]
MTGSGLIELMRRDEQAVIAWQRGRPVRWIDFISQAQALADNLPEASHAVNLCEDRYLFLLAFVALLLRGQVNLLPPCRTPWAVEKTSLNYPDSYCLVEHHIDELKLPQHVLKLDPAPAKQLSPLIIPQEQLAVIIFTSGSTGSPQPQRKYWGDLVRSVARGLESFKLDADAGGIIVATVPPQHMYGLETSILFPLLGNLAVHSGRPFFPADLHQALNEVPGPRVLITTPMHLRACVEAELSWPDTALIISATAPLTDDLARVAEQAFACEVHEIYGSTETGSIAHRHTLSGHEWLPYGGVKVTCADGVCRATAEYLREPTLLNDIIEVYEDYFLLLGRNNDMVNIAGKRASLSELTQRLLAIPGIKDAAVLMLDEGNERVGRLSAMVVAEQLSVSDIQQKLLLYLDPVFIPRLMYLVPKLPRNETGKLPRNALLAMLQDLRSGNEIQ